MLCLFPRLTHGIFGFWCLVFLLGRSRICEDQGNVACDCKWMWDFSVFSVVWNSLFMWGRQKHTNTFPYCIHYVFACLIWRVSWHLCPGERREKTYFTTKLNIYQYWCGHDRRVEWHVWCRFTKNGNIVRNQWQIILSVFPTKGWNCTFWLFITWLTRTLLFQCLH